MSIEYVTKRNGEKEPFDINKILKWELWACGGIKQHVDWKDIIIKVKAQIYDGMSTQDIQLKLIEECNNRRSWYHSVVAGRLYAAYVSKKIHGETKPTVEQLHKDLQLKGAMASMSYTVQDYAKIEQMIDHGKDFDLSYMQVYHLTNKYSLSDRVARIQYETPQYVFMRMATALAEDEGENRLDLVDRFYKFIGGSKINAPTPNYVNLGTPLNGYISCCLYTADDTAPSLAIGDHIAFTMTYMSAGIGGFLNIRSAKDKVKNGQIRHMGKLPYYKATAGAVNASMQSCYTSDTEILTENGFIPFTELGEDVKVAQVHNHGTIDFVIPEAIINTPYTGKIYHFTSNEEMSVDIAVTPNHRMAWRETSQTGSDRHVIGDEYKITAAEDFIPSEQTIIDFSGKALGSTTMLAPMTRLCVAYQADELAVCSNNLTYTLHASDRHKLDYLKFIVRSAKLSYTENTDADGVTAVTFQTTTPLTKDFGHLSLSGLSASWCEAFLREAAYWSKGHPPVPSMGSLACQTSSQKAARFIQSVAALCGAYSEETVNDLNGLYTVYVSFNHRYTTGRAIDKQTLHYSGTVHCVTVPTGNVVIRRNGKTAVCGNSRGGASTQYFSSYDPEVLDIIYLQNPRTPIAKQNRDLHFAMQFNSLFIEKFFKNEKYFTFNKFTAPDLMDAMFQGEAKFREVYARYEADSTFKKNYVEARQIGLLAGRQAHEVSTVYFLNVDEVNHHTPFKEPILQSNLCVAPETQILTKEHGYQPIETLKDQDVHVWNGHEWSKTKVVQTGENQKLLTVMTTSGETIDATPYHKWYVKDGQRIVIKPTTDLKPGDKLVSYQLSPADHGTVDFIDGDTTVTPYDAHFTVPGIEYTIQARLNWFANLLDFFAHMTVNKRELYVVLEDYDQDFLLALKLMLQELGAHSHLKSARYQEEETWSLYISEASMLHLKGLGLQAEVLINDAFQALAQEPAHHVEILSVNDIGRTDDTYCVNEPLRHTVMFNGVLTGNCTEIVQPTKPYQRMEDLYSDELHERGEISLCALGGIVPSNIASDEEYEEAAYLSLLMVDKCIYKNKYVFPHVEKTAKARMNAAIGMIGIAYDMAKKGLKWNSTEGLQYLHFLAERHMYFLIKASLKLGKERGNAPWIHKTKWPEGWLPIDTYNKNVYTIADFKLHYDWETLRQEVIANGGIRNSVLCAFMPTESSSKATGLPNGIYPIRDLYLKKTDGSNAIDYTAKESDILGHAYQTAYELSAEDLYKVYGVFQKFCDQAPSGDIYSDRVANPKLKASRIMDELLYMYKYGVKSRYYTNSKTTDSATLDSLDSDGACAGGACSL